MYVDVCVCVFGWVGECLGECVGCDCMHTCSCVFMCAHIKAVCFLENDSCDPVDMFHRQAIGLIDNLVTNYDFLLRHQLTFTITLLLFLLPPSSPPPLSPSHHHSPSPSTFTLTHTLTLLPSHPHSLTLTPSPPL